MRGHLEGICTIAVALAATATAAQEPEPATRQALVEQEQTDKASGLQPYVPSTFERVMGRLEDVLTNQTITWHPYRESAAHDARRVAPRPSDLWCRHLEHDYGFGARFAELLTRIYMDGRQRRIYTVAQTRTREPRRLWTDPRPAHVDTPVLLQ